MTMSTPSYKAPTGFYQSYTFDKSGQVFADGKELNGVKLGSGAIKAYGNGGNISSLSIDDSGKVYASLATPTTEKATGVGTKGTGWTSPQPTQWSDKFATAAAPTKVELAGIALDPTRISRGSGGALGDNQLYLRPDASGAYFAQVNKGDNVAAYAYSAINTAQTPVGGPDAGASNRVRRQGGNAGGGASTTSSTVSLLGD